eukprot:COSAG06_NODE_35847_length_454_cov_79.949296_1_plen_74_part_10
MQFVPADLLRAPRGTIYMYSYTMNIHVMSCHGWVVVFLNAGLATYGARSAKARRVLQAEAPVGARASWGGAAAR